jgi:hypothetical protein
MSTDFSPSAPCYLSYRYVDRGNWKVHACIKLTRPLDQHEREQISATLHEGSLFLPSQVGLVAMQGAFTWRDEDSIIWHEIDLDTASFTDGVLVAESPTEDFVARFASVGGQDNWDVRAAIRELNQLPERPEQIPEDPITALRPLFFPHEVPAEAIEAYQLQQNRWQDEDFDSQRVSP